MTYNYNRHDAVHWHVNEITSRIIAESGIPSDRFHLGKIIMQSLKDEPNLILQIDGFAGQMETNSSVLRRSIQCTIGLRRLGLQTGDVMVIMAPNHLHLTVAFYAALFEGIAIGPVDISLRVLELEQTFSVLKPRIIFSQSERVPDITMALKNINHDAKIVSFNDGYEYNLSQLLELADEDEIHNYRAMDFDPDNTISFLIPTSGTTGPPKASVTTHKNFAIMNPYIWGMCTKIPCITRALTVSPLQWLSALIMYCSSPLLKFTRIQSSHPMTQQHAYDVINKYKPTYMIISPTMMSTLLRPGDRDRCDFTCFKSIMMGGSAVYSDLISEIKRISPETDVRAIYGMSEAAGMIFGHCLSSPPESCGKPINCFLYRLVDVETGTDINEANKSGELWIKGPGILKEYYNNPEATKESLDDNWFKTGDLMYRDEYWNFFFVERIKLLLKYRNHQISPVEVEAVIRRHPGVLDVVVTAVPDAECGDLPVACVVPKPGYAPTPQEIKQLVKDSLTDTKQLRGGVVFLDQIPMTPSTKVHRRKIREMVLSMKRE